MSVITDAAAKAGGGATRNSSETATTTESDRSTDPFTYNYTTPSIDMNTLNTAANLLVALATLKEVVRW